MRQPVSFLTQSKFYSPVFNAAIFDGPIRIYFAQYQESLALKVYFHLQQKIKGAYDLAKDNFKSQGRNIFVMLYPAQENFDLAFEGESISEEKIIACPFGEDHIVGVCGPLEDEAYSGVYAHIESIVNDWASSLSHPPVLNEGPTL